MNSKSSGNGLEGFLTGKGFYIVLFLCAAVIGLSAWMMAAGNETMEDLTSSDVSMNSHRVETILITPDVQTSKVEVMAIPEPTVEPAAAEPEETEELEETLPVWNGQSIAEPEPLWPVQGELERMYDVDHLHYDVTMRDWRTHEGVDIAAPLGETVCAALPGVVTYVQDDGFYGTYVTVDHGDGTSALYANLAAIPAVNVGDWVGAGDVIGAVGATALCEIGQGTHLHFAVYLDGESVDPMNYLPA
jgi:murein DD-endopeptidase MepM/ murein hydrolase activator NlpD